MKFKNLFLIVCIFPLWSLKLNFSYYEIFSIFLIFLIIPLILLSLILKKNYKNNSLFKLDIDPSNINSLEQASLLITDNSTISLEFSIIFKRPTLYVNYSEKIHNNFYNLIEEDTFEDSFKKNVCFSIDAVNLKNLNQTCENILYKNSKFLEKVQKFTNEKLPNIDGSIERAVNYIKKINSNL